MFKYGFPARNYILLVSPPPPPPPTTETSYMSTRTTSGIMFNKSCAFDRVFFFYYTRNYCSYTYVVYPSHCEKRIARPRCGRQGVSLRGWGGLWGNRCDIYKSTGRYLLQLLSGFKRRKKLRGTSPRQGKANLQRVTVACGRMKTGVGPKTIGSQNAKHGCNIL